MCGVRLDSNTLICILYIRLTPVSTSVDVSDTLPPTVALVIRKSGETERVSNSRDKQV